MFWTKKKENQILKSLNGNEVNWNEDTLLLDVNDGQALLKYKYGRAKNGHFKAFLILNDIPLVKWHSDEYNCPTCRKLLSAGQGINEVNESLLEQVRITSNIKDPVSVGSIDDIMPIIKLLENGLYAISRMKLYPTNGDGNFFWDVGNQERYYTASCDLYYNLRHATGYPAFLVPTQPSANYNADRVEFYRKLLREGQTLGGVAYYLEGFLCALLDGHHRATACMLEGKDFYCLVIMRLGAWGIDQNQNKDYAIIGGQWIEMSNVSNSLKDKYRKMLKSNTLNGTTVEEYLNINKNTWSNYWTEEILTKAKAYPTCEDIAMVRWAGDLSDEAIEQLFLDQRETMKNQLDIVFRALIATKDSRAITVALRICRLPALVSLWKKAFCFLSTIRSQEVEDFFINFLVNDEKIRPELTIIADEYFKQS